VREILWKDTHTERGETCERENRWRKALEHRGSLFVIMNRASIQWATEVFKPVVLVCGSEKAEKICQKNGITLSEMLRPFGNRIGGGDGGVRFRTPNQTLKVVHGYGVQILSGAEIDKIAATRVAPLDDVMRANVPSEQRKSDDIFDMSDAARFFIRNPDPTPWFTAYRTELHKSLGFTPYEFTEQPLGMIFVISSDEEAPARALASLRNKANLPKPLAHSLLDNEVPYACWVLHDISAKEVGLEKAEVAMKELEARYPSHCTLLAINSAPENTELEDIWAACFSSDAKNGVSGESVSKKGTLLTLEDRKLLASAIRDFVIKTLNPSLERKLASLNAEVNDKRKGIGNTLKYMFGGRKSSKQGRSNLGAYELGTLESKIRQAADFALLMQDFETASSNYRIAKQDYQHDKKHALLASANELHGLCTLLSSHGRSGTGYIEAAIQIYQSNSEIAKATRAALWAVDAFRHGNMPNAAATWLKRASERESHRSGGSQLRAALLIEQAAYMYLIPSGAGVQLRKYAFHLIMAGHIFHKCRLHWHGVRCYRSARCVLKDKRWFHAGDHIDYDLARHFSSLGQAEEALHYFSSSVDFSLTPNPFVLGLNQLKDIDDHSAADEKMMLANHKQVIKRPRRGEQQQQPPERQAVFVSELRALVDSIKGKPVAVPELRLPLLKDDTVHVSLAVNSTLPSDIAPLAWGSILFAQIPLPNDLETMNKPLFDLEQVKQKAKEDERYAFVGEAVNVSMVLVNPLHTPLKVEKLKLLCGVSINGSKPITPEVGVIEDDNFTLTEAKINLPPMTESEVCISVTCKKEGVLHVSGAEWILYDSMRVTHRFELPPVRKIKTTTTGRKRAISTLNTSLSVSIRASAALLSAEIVGLSDHILQSQVSQTSLRLTNVGNSVVEAGTIQIKISHPSCVILEESSGNILEYDLKSGLVSLPYEVAPGHSKEVKMWIRAATVGVHNLGFLIRYGYKDVESKVKHRVAYLERNLESRPLLSVDVFTRPSIRFANTDSSLLMSMIRNETSQLTPQQGGKSIQLHSAMMISETFEIIPSKMNGCIDLSLHPDESYNLVLRVHTGGPSRKLVTPGNPAYLLQPSNAASKVSCNNFSQTELKTNPAIWKLLSMEKVLDNLELQRKISLNPNKYKTMEKNEAKKDFDLLFLWTEQTESKEQKNEPAYGFHLLRNQKCLHSLYSKNMSACPLKVMVRHPQEVEHDFTKGRLFIPVDIQVCNRRDDVAVSFVFETLPPNQEFDSISRSFKESKNHSMASRYFWSGVTSQRIQNLGPNQRVTLKVNAVFHADGEYNLNRFRFSVDMPNIGIKHFFFPLQHLISITSERSRLRQ